MNLTVLRYDEGGAFRGSRGVAKLYQANLAHGLAGGTLAGDDKKYLCFYSGPALFNGCCSLDDIFRREVLRDSALVERGAIQTSGGSSTGLGGGRCSRKSAGKGQFRVGNGGPNALTQAGFRHGGS